MPLQLHSEDVKKEWLDVYGHMNEAYYLVSFSNATWALQDYFNIGPTYTEDTDNALYTVESHLRYLHEVRAPAKLNIDSFIFGFDKKRIHVGHIMMVNGKECATFECILLHINMKAAKSTAFSEEQLSALASAPAGATPSWSGSAVSLRR